MRGALGALLLALALGGSAAAQPAATRIAALRTILRDLDGPDAAPTPAQLEAAGPGTLAHLAELATIDERVDGVPARLAAARLALQIGNVLLHRHRRPEDASLIARSAQSVYTLGLPTDDEPGAQAAMARAIAEARENMARMEGARDLNRARDPKRDDRLWIGGVVLVVALGALAFLRRRALQPDGVRVADADIQREARAALETGLALLREERIEDSIPYLQRVSELQSTLRDNGRYSLALVEMRRGDLDAAAELSRDLDVSRVDPEEAYTLADEMERRGQARSARRLFEKLYLADVNFKDVQERLESLRAQAAEAGEEDVARLIVERVVDPRFEEVRLLASGGMGFVFRARDQERDGQTVALKVLSPFYANDPDAYSRFLKEAQGLAQLTHPGIIRIYDVFGKSLPYYSMELHETPDLASMLADEGPLDPTRVRAYGLQLCDALDTAHAAGVIHRDVKPANILADADGHLTLLDFGVARFSDATHMTLTGQVLGSPRYMAPEQGVGFDMDHRVDVYATALVLFELLTGTVPPPEERQGSMQPPSLPEALAIPSDLAAALTKALEPDPDRRFASMAAFRSALAGEGG